MGTYVITGGASGIGAAIRQQLESEGHRTLVVDIKEADVVADLGTPAGRAAAVAAIREHCANDLAGLVCSAGLGSHVPDRALITAVNYFGAVELVEGLRDLLAGQRAPVLLVSKSTRNMASTWNPK